MKKYVATVIVTFAFFVGYLLYVPPFSQTADDVLIVGMMSGWAPFMTINSAGNYEGFDVDVAQEIACRMNKKIEIQDLGSLASCFVALDQGRIDMLMSGLDITQKRREALNMIYYTGDNVTEFNLVFWNEVLDGIQSMEDLRTLSDAIICAESGSAQEKFLDSYDFVTKKRMNSVVDIVLDLRFGKSLAAILEPRVAARLKRQNPELQLLPVALPPSFQVFGCGIALKKNNAELASKVSSIVKSMIVDGTMKNLERKWQLEE